MNHLPNHWKSLLSSHVLPPSSWNDVFHTKANLVLWNLKWAKNGEASHFLPSQSWRRPQKLCGCVRRNRWWWGRRRRSSPRRLQGRRVQRCRRGEWRRSSPWGRAWSPPLWCCHRIPARRKSPHPLLLCSKKVACIHHEFYDKTRGISLRYFN